MSVSVCDNSSRLLTVAGDSEGDEAAKEHKVGERVSWYSHEDNFVS